MKTRIALSTLLACLLMSSAMLVSCKRDSSTPSPLDPAPVSESKKFFGLFRDDGAKDDTPAVKEPEPSMQSRYGKWSVVFGLAIIPLLFLKFRKEAGLAAFAAIGLPMLGKATDIAIGFTPYAVIAGIIAGMIYAWNAISKKHGVEDDGNWFTDIYRKLFKSKKGMHVG